MSWPAQGGTAATNNMLRRAVICCAALQCAVLRRPALCNAALRFAPYWVTLSRWAALRCAHLKLAQLRQARQRGQAPGGQRQRRASDLQRAQRAAAAAAAAAAGGSVAAAAQCGPEALQGNTHTHTHTHENASRVCSTQAVHCAVQMCAVGLHSQRQGRLQAGPGTRLQRCQARVRLQLLQQVPLVCEAQRAQAAGAPPRPRRQLPPKQGGLREGVARTGFVQGARASRQAGWAAGRCQSKTDHCENSMLRRAQTAAVRHR